MVQLLGWKALAPELSLLESRGSKDAVEYFSFCIRTFANEALVDHHSQESLESFLNRLAQQFPIKMAVWLPRHADALADVLNRFEELVADFCASPHDLLGQLFTGVAKTAASFYREHGVALPPTLWQRTYSLVSFLSGEAGLSFAPDIHLTARTKFNVDSSDIEASAQVQLKVVPRLLEIETICALPRVLLHEYIAHVPQGPHSVDRIHPDPSDAFAEGWMDYIAHRIHKAVLEQTGPYEALIDCLDRTLFPFYEAAAERFFQARSAFRGRDAAAAARSEGAKTARLLHDLLRTLPETSGDADALMYRLSFELNSSALDSILRQRLVAEIHLSLIHGSRSDHLVNPLRDWAAGKSDLIDLCTCLGVGIDIPSEVRSEREHNDEAADAVD